MLATKNPWTLEQREIIAAIVNDALTIKLEASDVVGCVVEGDDVHVIWNGEFRQSFWFGREWFRDRVAAKKQELELRVECAKRGLRVMLYTEGDEGFYICCGNQYIGQMIAPGQHSDYWSILPSYGSRQLAGRLTETAVNDLYVKALAVSL
jgi:hypothetical protein